MAFDAGAITASLTLDPSQFDRTLTDAEARVKRFEAEKHEVKLSAVFDSSSISRARQQFAQLDQTISKDAMSRLRSSPQGSVLGALNALFSPHPVTGAPSPQQAAQQGLLGKIVSQPSGGGAPGGSQGSVAQDVLGSSAAGTSQSNAGQRDTATTDRVNVTGAPTDNNITTTDRVNAVGLPTDNAITTQDRVNVTGLPTSGGAITTQDRVNVTGLPTSGGTITTEDKVKPELDEASLKADAGKAGTDAADAADDAMTSESKRKGSGWFSGFLAGISGMVSKALGSAVDDAEKDAAGGGGKNGGLLASLLGGGSSEGGGGEESALDKGLVGAIGPGILGTSFKTSSIAGLGGAALGAIPALTAGAAPLALAGAGAGILTAGASQLIGSKDTKDNPDAEGPLYAQAQAAGAALQAMVKTAATGLVTPLKNLFNEIPSLAKQITPALSQVFTSTAALIQPVVTGLVGALKEIAPGLSAAFKAAGPLLQPLITGIGQLVGGLMPGLVAMLKAAGPAVSVLSGFFGTLGGALGTMFRDFSTVIGPSSTILKALLDVVAGLLPVIGSLAQVMAGALGPAFTAFAGTIQALEPFLVTVGKILAQFAGAVLTDLSGGLQLVANVLKAVAPAFNTLATALGQVFNTLESKGGFQQLGNILEGIATPLGTLISKLVSGLAPAIPPILSLFSQLVNVVSTVGVQVLTALIPPITNLVTIALGALLKVLPAVIPIVTQFLTAFTVDAGAIITQVGGALLNLATVVLLKLLQAAQPLIPVVLDLLNAFTPLLNILTPVVAGTITAIANALAAVVNAIPPAVITGVAVAIGSVVGGMKLWAVATSAVATGMKAITGSSIVSWASGAVAGFKDFQAAAEGAALSEKALVAGELALDALGPGALIGLAAAVATLGAALVLTNAQSTTIVGSFAQQEQALNYNIGSFQKLAGTVSTAAQGYAGFAKANSDAVRGGAAGAAYLAGQLDAQAAGISQVGATMVARVKDLSQNLGVSQTAIEQWAHAAGISAAQFGGAGESVGKLTQQVIDFVNKNAQAVTAVSSVSTNIAIFGNDAFTASTQLDAFNGIWNILVGNLLTKQQAITQGQTSFDNLKQSITQSGAASDQSKQSFQAYVTQIGSSLDSLEKGGASVSTLNGYLQTQIAHLQSLGPLNKSQQADLNGLITFSNTLANSTHGLTDAQLTWIQQAEGHLIPDLQSMGADTPKVTADVNNLANSIAQTGTKSASTAADRAKLIADLEAAGVQSSKATSFVNGLSSSLSKVPKAVSTTVGVKASAQGTLTAVGTTLANQKIQASLLFGAADGGYIAGPGSPKADDKLIRVSAGEYVIQASSVDKYGKGFMDAINARRFASGGSVDLAGPSSWSEGQDASWAQSDVMTFMSNAASAFSAANKAALAAVAAASLAQSLTHPTGSGATIQALMQSMAASVGWTGAEWTALNAVEQREAGFSLTATNPTSGAYGLAQFIDGASEYAQYGGNSTTAQGQITGMLNYIKSRYGDPIAAEAHEQAFGWYGNGGIISEPVIGRGMNSGRGYVLGERGSEMVTPIGGSQGSSMSDLAARLDQLHADMREMVSATRAVPAGVGQHVGGALGGAAHDASFRSRYPRST